MVVLRLDYHKEMIDHIKYMNEQKTIHSEDMELILFANSVKEMKTNIEKYTRSKLEEMNKLSKRKPIWLQGEQTLKNNHIKQKYLLGTFLFVFL